MHLQPLYLQALLLEASPSAAALILFSTPVSVDVLSFTGTNLMTLPDKWDLHYSACKIPKAF